MLDKEGKRLWSLRLQGMIESIEQCLEFVAESDLEAFRHDYPIE